MWGASSPPALAPSRLPPASSAYVFTVISGLLLLLLTVQQRIAKSKPRWLPKPGTEKYEYEVWILRYSVVWMGAFGLIIVFEVYESFDALAYFLFLGGLALPLVLQPLLFRGKVGALVPSIGAQHAARAQVWIMVFGFIGNYWYTHYFYCVLRARYTMPSWRLNDVPIAMYFATHFYFSSYHVFANLPLRYVRSAYEAGPKRTLLEVSLVLAMSYATAFMETLTISHFPYYDFEDRDLAYTVGSAFYGIYFIVSFPVYFFLDEERTPAKATSTIQALVDAAASSLASGMLVLLLLDLTRLSVVGVPLHVGGKLVEATGY
jgi:cycloeucalenol cycloisomerase